MGAMSMVSSRRLRLARIASTKRGAAARTGRSTRGRRGWARGVREEPEELARVDDQGRPRCLRPRPGRRKTASETEDGPRTAWASAISRAATRSPRGKGARCPGPSRLAPRTKDEPCASSHTRALARPSAATSRGPQPPRSEQAMTRSATALRSIRGGDEGLARFARRALSALLKHDRAPGRRSRALEQSSRIDSGGAGVRSRALPRGATGRRDEKLGRWAIRGTERLVQGNRDRLRRTTMSAQSRNDGLPAAGALIGQVRGSRRPRRGLRRRPRAGLLCAMDRSDDLRPRLLDRRSQDEGGRLPERRESAAPKRCHGGAGRGEDRRSPRPMGRPPSTRGSSIRVVVVTTTR